MTVKLEEIMAQMPEERQQKILKRVDELIAQEKAIDENINSSFDMEDKPQLNREKNQVLPHK